MASHQHMFTVGTEYQEVKFNDFRDWFISITPIGIHWKNEPTYVISQAIFLFGALATFVHAVIRGGRLPYLWLGTILHGLVVEIMSYVIPDVDNFWHSQTPVIFLGRRLPLHIIALSSFTFWFHFSRKLICKSEGKWVPDNSIWRELLCTIAAGVLGTPGGILLFMPVYHPLHDLYGIHSEVTFFIIFAVFLAISWSGDRISRDSEKTPCTIHWSSWIPLLFLILHYTWYLVMVIFFNPENEVSVGLKEPIGPCDEYVTLRTVFGSTLKKRKYLCATDYDEKYFNWKCLPNGKPPSQGSHWYTTCGVPLPNRAEFITILATIYFTAFIVFTNLHFRSFGDKVFDFSKTISKPANKKQKRN